MAARIDHRSYKEQRIDLIPTIHEGYEVRAMEKRGIKTVIGELNRAIRQFNQMFISLKESIQWIAGRIRHFWKACKIIMIRKRRADHCSQISMRR